jgi:lipopolysaccharide transport system ATP-binding protein
VAPETEPSSPAEPSSGATGGSPASASPESDAAAEPPPAGEAAAGQTLRWGSGEAVIERVRLLVDGEERYHVRTGETVVFSVEARAHRDFDDFVFGIGLFTPRGTECWGVNTDLDGLEPERLRAGPVAVEVCCPDLRLAPGEYLLDVAVHARDGTPYDYRRRLLTFSVTAAERGVGLYFPRHSWSFSEGVEWADAAGAARRGG